MRTADKVSSINLLQRLYRQLSRKLQIRLWVILAMMLVGAALEAMTLGAVLPFLAFVSAPETAWNYLGRVGIKSLAGYHPGDNLLIVAASVFIGFSVMAAVYRTALLWTMNKFVLAFNTALSTKVLRNVIHQDYTFHISQNTSKILSSIQDVRQIGSTILQPLMQVCASCLLGLSIVATLFFIHPMIATIAFGSIGLAYITINAIFRSKVQARGTVIAKLQAKRLQTVQEGLGGIRDILLDSSQHIVLDKFTRVDRQVATALTSNNLAGSAPRYAIETIGMILITMAALYFNQQPGGLAAALPLLATLALSAQRLLPLMQQGYSAAVQLLGHWSIFDELLSILETPVPSEYFLPAPLNALPFQRAIEFHGVSFRYQPEQALVLRSINLAIPKGCRVGVVGKTGSGKSTLTDLIMGLLEPSEGRITVDAVEITGVNRRAWHKAIAHVPQTIYLSDSSIAENIAFGVPSDQIDMHRVRKAAEQAELSSFLDTLPSGVETFVGERGIRLSGGQRQRIGIARALYKGPSVLILDEATSALDSDTEAAVMGSIKQLSRDLTIVIVAHRHSTLDACDFIIRLDNGVISNTELLHQRTLMT